MTYEQETLWLAGLLEGEGCFASACGRSSYNNGMKVILMMTDEDIVRRAADIMGSKVYSRRPSGKGILTVWATTAHGDRAVAAAQRVLPFMGQRRKAKIEELLVRAANRMSQQECGRLSAKKCARGYHGRFAKKAEADNTSIVIQ